MMSFISFTLLISTIASVIFANANFECDDTTKQCNCTKDSCNQICSEYNKCNSYQFYCSNQSHSCSILCLSANSCKNTIFYLRSRSSNVQCIGAGACNNVKFECESINNCALQTNMLSFTQSQFICYGNGDNNENNQCYFQFLNNINHDIYGILSCLLNENELIQCAINSNKLSCLNSSLLNNKCNTMINCSGELCNEFYLSFLPDINLQINDSINTVIINNNNNINNNILENDINIWILTIVFMLSISLSCVLYYCCLSLIFHTKTDNNNNNNKTDNNNNNKTAENDNHKTAREEGIVNKKKKKRNGKTKIKTKKENSKNNSKNTAAAAAVAAAVVYNNNNHFESSFWLTILSTLFNDEDKTDGIDCGIILIPNKQPIEEILNSIFRGCSQCKVPVTEQFLKHYGKTSRKANSYIVIQSGYIYAHGIYNDAQIKNIKQRNETIYQIANSHNYIIIDSQKKQTQKHNNAYYRIFVNNLRVKSADQFCKVFASHGININLKNDETTTTWKVRESLELSSDFFENKAEGMAATNLANSLHFLQERRSHRTHAEMVGATIVVIPYDKTLADYKLYLRQYLCVSMQVSDSSLLCIFSHKSVLHDGAIFVRGNRIIAVKAFFRITGQYKNKPSIGHGTRHASAQEFSKHAKLHQPITFVLSEEDGQIRSCIVGEIKKINYKFIARLVIEHHHSHKLTNKVDKQTQQTEGTTTNDTNDTTVHQNTIITTTR